MHQIARIELERQNFPRQGELPPCTTPTKGLCPLDARQGASPLDPHGQSITRAPLLSSGWIRPCHNSILKHMLTALRGFIGPTNNDLSFLVTSADTRPLEVPLPVDVIVSELKPDMVFNNKKDNTIQQVKLTMRTVPFEITSRKLTIVRLRQIETLIVSDILCYGFTCDLTCFEIGSHAHISPENIRDIDKIFAFVNTKASKSFRKELSKVTLLKSYTICNARQEPARGSENQLLLSA